MNEYLHLRANLYDTYYSQWNSLKFIPRISKRIFIDGNVNKNILCIVEQEIEKQLKWKALSSIQENIDFRNNSFDKH